MKSNSPHKIKAILSVILVAVIVALSAATTPAVLPAAVAKAATKLSLNKTSRNILVGKKYNLNINNKIKGSTYKWTTTNSKIATVDKQGIVTGKSQGTATITCKVTTPDGVYELTCKVTVRQPALRFKIKNKITALNLGQEYDLNRILVPSASNDKTTWTSSDETIAKPDSLGKFTALKEGTVTITGTTMSGASDSVTFTVIDKAGVVTNQEELEALVGSGASNITIKTEDEVKFTIPNGKYLNQGLVVDAPNADVENNGVFESIEIKQIKSSTWYERAVGNLLTILAKDTRVIVGSGASVTIEVKEEGAVLRIENNGKIEEIVIDQKADIELSGESDEEVPVTVNIPDITIKTSVPLNLYCQEKIDLVLLEGAEDTKIQAATNAAIPSIKGNVTIQVVVGTGEATSVETVVGKPIPTTPPPMIGGGGGPIIIDPNPTPEPEDSKTYHLEKSLNELTKVDVKYAGLTYSVDSTMLAELKRFLNNEQQTMTTWLNTTNTTKTYSGVSVNVTGKKDSYTKTVTFTNGLLKGRSYQVTVNPTKHSVTLKGASLTFIITKVDDKSIKISPAPDGLTFTEYYN